MYINYKEAAEIANCGERTIRRWAKAGKLNLYGGTRSQKRILKEELESKLDKKTISFFNEVNPLSAYWAGFIFADGCIYSDRNRLSLNLARKDIDHLRKFSFSLLGQDIVKLYEAEGYDKCTLSIDNCNLRPSLEKFGVIPNKTYNFLEPKIPHRYLGDFVRGLFDGDGCCDSERARIACSPKCSEWLKSVLPCECKIYKQSASDFCMSVEMSNKADIMKFYSFCLGWNTPRLERKWVIMDNVYKKYMGW
jgi:hypothetical protein